MDASRLLSLLTIDILAARLLRRILLKDKLVKFQFQIGQEVSHLLENPRQIREIGRQTEFVRMLRRLDTRLRARPPVLDILHELVSTPPQTHVLISFRGLLGSCTYIVSSKHSTLLSLLPRSTTLALDTAHREEFFTSPFWNFLGEKG
jgi:hypothetical protein